MRLRPQMFRKHDLYSIYVVILEILKIKYFILKKLSGFLNKIFIFNNKQFPAFKKGLILPKDLV